MNKIPPLFIKSFLITTTLTTTLLGCASAGIQSSSGQQVNDVMSVFENGDARLTCQVSCSGAWGASRRKAKGFYENELWDDLVRQVTSVGFETDLSYFYLGRAAEGLGKTKAARIYYKLALSKIHKCAGLFNNCDGFKFPDEIYSRLNPLNAEVAKEAAAKEAAAKEAAAKEAAAKEAIAKEAVAKEAAAKEAAAKEAVAKEAVAKEAAAKEAAAKAAVAKEAAAKEAAAKEAAAKEAAAKAAVARKAGIARKAAAVTKEEPNEKTSESGDTSSEKPLNNTETTQKKTPLKVRSIMDL